MFTDFLETRLQQTICYLLIADYCSRLEPNNPLKPLHEILDQFNVTTKAELRHLHAYATEEKKNDFSLQEAEAAVEQFVNEFKQGAAHYIVNKKQ